MYSGDPFRHRRTFESLPGAWLNWKKRICEVVGLDANKLLSQQFVKPRMLLIPEKNEINDSDFIQLAEDLRDYLCADHAADVHSAAQKIANLHPEASLPFLYAMRYIGLQEGKSHFYWPEFYEHLFCGVLKYENNRSEMAEATSGLWINLYQYLGGKLYYPREGPRHIKWPLAHAGLIPDHKNSIRDFGNELVRSGGIELFDETIQLEVDEFLLRLEDWLQTDAFRKNSSLATSILQHGTNREIIAELGLHWLGAKRIIFDVYDKALTTAKEKKHKNIHSIRRFLLYEEQKNQVRLAFIHGRTTEKPIVDWNGEKYEFHTQYDPRTQEYIPLELQIPINESTWPEKASIRAGVTINYEISLPTLENRSAVFEVGTGHLTKRWEPGRQYYVLIPGKKFKDALADQLFSDWFITRAPEGKWTEYYLLRVKTKDPFSDDKSPDGISELQVLEQFEEAADKLGLPSFGHIFGVHVVLFGGELSAICSSDRQDEYSDYRTPLAEIMGIWKEPTRIQLTKLNERTNQYEPISDFEIGTELSGKKPILDVFETKAEPGRYKLQAEEESIDITIRPMEIGEYTIYAPALKLDCWLEDTNKSQFKKINRKALDKLILNVKAWPMANLTIEITGGGIEQKFTYQADNEGKLEIPIDQFGLHAIPNGSIQISTNWNGFISSKVELSEKDIYIRPNITTYTHIPNKTIIRGDLNKKPFFTQISGYLLSDPPWKDCCPFDIKIDIHSGTFTTTINKPGMDPGWAILCEKIKQGDGQQEIIGIGDIGSNKPIELSNLLNAAKNYSEKWSKDAKRISEIPHPASIETYLGINDLMVFLRDEQSKWEIGAHWEKVADLENNDDLNYSKGIRVSVFSAPMKKVTEANCCYTYTLKKDPKSRGDYGLYEENSNNLLGSVKPSGSPERFDFITSNKIKVCSKCGLVLPINDFNGHKAAFKGWEDCTGIGAIQSQISPGKSLPIEMAILHNPLDQLEAIQGLLIRLSQKDKTIDRDQTKWLYELKEHIAVNIDPHEWVSQMITNLRIFKIIFSCEAPNTNELVFLSKNLRFYEEGLKFIFGSFDIFKQRGK